MAEEEKDDLEGVSEEESEEEDGDVIILKDGEDLFDDDEVPQEFKKETTADKIKKVLEKFKTPKVIFGVSLFLLAVIFLIIFLTLSSEEEQENPYLQGNTIARSLKEKDLIAKDLKQNSIEKLIAKATILYEKGEKERSLDLFNEVAIYNESLSWYNLGVARVKEKDFENALVAFKRALNTNEHRCESAINAAVASLILGDIPGFEYYIGLAYDYLPERAASPIYSYLYTVINHYKDRPFQVIAGANEETIKDYSDYKHRIAAKSFLMLEDAKSAVAHLELAKTREDFLTLGLLYGRIGDYDNAKDRLKQSIAEKVDENRSREALILTYLKTGELNEAGNAINGVVNSKSDIGAFPVRVKLKKRLFDVDLAQEYFSKNILLDNEVFLGALFYFTPYQILDPTRTLKLIQKGEMSINASEVSAAKEYLENSVAMSGVHGNLTLGVKLAINNRLIEANEIFKKIEKGYRSHDVLEYNLALSYAQLGDYANAYRHFDRAYFLNRNNHMAGVFSVITSRYAGKNEDDNLKVLLEFFQEKNDDESRFYLAILNFYTDNILAFARWLESPKKEDPRYILLDIFTADKLERFNVLKEKTSKLYKMFPREFLANVLDIYADNRKYSIKQKAFGFQDFMQFDDFDKEALFYGSPIVRDMYIRLGLLTGNLRQIRGKFQEKLAVEVSNPRGLMQGLALIDIYLGYFEESFTLYNQLIDEQGFTDTKTLLLASVAAIGAGHKENAIALLELAILKDKRNFEARYGLALLYLEIQNYEGTAVQLTNVDPGVYNSDYYDFDLVNP